MMEKESSNLKILEKVEEWAIENLLDEHTLSIFLIGSWAEGIQTEISDIDIVVVKDHLSPFIQNKKILVHDKPLDIWFHDKEYMLKTINKQIESLSDIYQISLYVSFFGKCIVWYDKDNFIQNNLSICDKWQWNPEHRLYIQMMGKPPEALWTKQAYEENLVLLSRYEYRFDNGLPISHRLKEYPELHPVVEESQVMELFKATMFLYQEQRIEKEWTEVIDAKKAIQEKNWSVAFVSLKDVLYFLLRRYTSPPSMELRDPSFWSFAEGKIIPAEFIKALEIAYL